MVFHSTSPLFRNTFFRERGLKCPYPIFLTTSIPCKMVHPEFFLFSECSASKVANKHIILYILPQAFRGKKYLFFIIKDGCIVSATTPVLFFCPALHDTTDSSKSDDRRKTQVRETCTYGSVLLFDMIGSDRSVFVLSVSSCLSQVLAFRAGPCS